MAPIIASLIGSGLNILASAVVAKGKDVVEKKLGIDLESATMSEDGLFKLKELELQHEEFLQQAAMEESKAFFEDTKSARILGIELSKSTSWLNQNIMPILALVTVFGSSALLWLSAESDVKMAAVSFITMVLGYFFGSSKGSKDKQEQLYKMENS